MTLVDTNVISEMMRREPNARVVAWLDAQVAETLYVSAVSVAELLLGIACLPTGRRRTELERAFRDHERSLFGTRVVAFGDREAHAYAGVVSRARASGHVISIADGQIAATAAAGEFSIATRDVRPFAAAGLTVIDPWQIAASG
jgi:predicted nucleic acid-binding protein